MTHISQKGPHWAVDYIIDEKEKYVHCSNSEGHVTMVKEETL